VRGDFVNYNIKHLFLKSPSSPFAKGEINDILMLLCEPKDHVDPRESGNPVKREVWILASVSR